MKLQKLLLILLLVFISDLSIAQWTNNPTNPLPVRGSVGNYPTSNLDVTTDGNGVTLICWTDTRTGLLDVYAQKISSDGIPLWTLNGICVVNSPTYEYTSKIVSDGNGGAYVIWEKDLTGIGNNIDIRAQHLNDQGIKLWNVDGVLIKSSAGRLTGVVSYLQSGFIVAWSGSQSSFPSAQRVDNNGNLLWNSSGVRFVLSNQFNFSDPHITTDGAGGIIACGYGHYYLDKLLVQRINSSGQRLWGDTLGSVIYSTIPSSYELIGNPNLCTDGNGGAIVVFRRTGNYPNLPSGFTSLFSQRLNSNGIIQWDANCIPVCNNDTVLNYGIKSDGQGGAIFTWVDSPIGITFQDIWAQKINSDGVLLWSNKGVQVTNINNDEGNPDIISDGNGGAFVCYHTGDVYVQRIYSNGTFQWQNNGIPAIRLNGNDVNPKISYHSQNSVVVTSYTSASSFNSNIHSSKITTRNISFTGRIQGFYNPVSNQSVSDTLKFYIRKSSSPFQILDSQKVQLDVNGFAKFFEPYLDTYTSYYIQVRHRNSLETWSNLFNFDNSETLNYDFTTSQSQAYGNNQIQVDNSPVTFALYSGDVNQDGSIDLTDINSVFNDASNFVAGYLSTDVTGDGYTDLTDLTITFNNSSNFVGIVRP